jgi:hypothetical protein
MVLSKSIRLPSHPTPRVINVDKSVLPAGYEAVEEGTATAAPQSTEAGAIFEQHLGTGSSGYQTMSQSQPRLSVFLGSLADDRRL